MGTECAPKSIDIPSRGNTQNMPIDFREDQDSAKVDCVTCPEATVNPPTQSNGASGGCTEAHAKRSLRRKNDIYYGIFDMSSEEELDYELPHRDRTSRCSRQSNDVTIGPKKSKHEKASPTWRPHDACRPVIDEAPVFYPTEEEFIDTLRYIACIRSKAEKYGICRIIPPASWAPPCPLKEKSFWGGANFTTRVQQVDKLQNREPTRKKYKARCHRRRKRRKRLRFGMIPRHNTSNASENSERAASDSEEKFGFQSGSDFTLETFKKHADEFKEHYFGIVNNENVVRDEAHEERWRPSVEDIEGEYWRIVEEPTEEIEVDYGADLDTAVFGSGFPKTSPLNMNESDPYVLSGWNLNNLPRLPGSVLSFEKEDISGVLVPWLYVGMCFSSFCWHVEDHHLYSLNYMHFGEPKVWYGVPGGDAVKLENAMRKHLPDLFEEQPDLLHELVTQLSPSVLKSEGVPVYRAVQNSGEFVLTFPRAYHSGFNCGFNCAEAVNVAPVDWLPHGQCAVELYREQRRKTSLSHDKLLLATARQAVKELRDLSLHPTHDSGIHKWHTTCGKNGVLTKAFKERVHMEQKAREGLHFISQFRRMSNNFDSSSERECFLCHFDLHLSATGCECLPNCFACLAHASPICSCEPGRKFLFFRYDIQELNTPLAALEGDLSAARQWLLEDIGESPPSQLTTELDKSTIESLRPSVCTNTAIVDDRSNKNKVCPDLCCQLNEEKTSHCLQDMKGTTHLDKPLKSDHDVAEQARGHCPDLNAERPAIEANVTLESHDQHNMVSSVREEQGWSSTDSKHVYASHSKAMGISGHNMDTQMECDPTWSTNYPIKSSSDYGSSLSLNHSNVSASPSRTSSRKSNEVSNDPECPHKSSPKLFGFDLQPIGHHSSLSSGDQVYQTVKNNSDPFCEFAGHNHELTKACQLTKFSVELLDSGVVMHGKNWCTKQAIFPKGFRSRVRFFSVVDPRKTCSYISEVLDAGVLGPLFKVTWEECPEVCFTHTSAEQCWNLVRERLNEEIEKQRSLGNTDLPDLQSQGSINGLEMFGFPPSNHSGSRGS